jgi:hypothetical protein
MSPSLNPILKETNSVTSSHPISLISILILSFYLRPGLPGGQIMELITQFSLAFLPLFSLPEAHSIKIGKSTFRKISALHWSTHFHSSSDVAGW